MLRKIVVTAIIVGPGLLGQRAAGDVVMTPHNFYDLGTWDTQIDSETYTGNGVDSKLWEYQNVIFPNTSNTNLDPNFRRTPAYFTHKYVSNTPIGALNFRYSDGYMQEDIAGQDSKIYLEVSTDGVNFMNIWQQAQQIPGDWTQYVVMPAYLTFNLPAGATTLYMRHGVTFAYDVLWQMGGPHSESGVIFTQGVAPVAAEWANNNSGSWSIGTNWTGGVPNGIDTTANFLGAITAPQTVSLDGAQTVGTINFNNTHSYTLGGGSVLTLDGGLGHGEVNVISGSHSISAPVVLNTPTTFTASERIQHVVINGKSDGDGPRCDEGGQRESAV
jgi:hypothetical protein